VEKAIQEGGRACRTSSKTTGNTKQGENSKLGKQLSNYPGKTGWHCFYLRELIKIISIAASGRRLHFADEMIK